MSDKPNSNLLVTNPTLQIQTSTDSTVAFLPYAGTRFIGNHSLTELLSFFGTPRDMSASLFEFIDADLLVCLKTSSLLVPPGFLPLYRGLLSPCWAGINSHTTPRVRISDYASGRVILGVPVTTDQFGHRNASIGPKEIHALLDEGSQAWNAYIGNVLNFPDESPEHVYLRLKYLLEILHSLNITPLLVGGDHSITKPALELTKSFYPDVVLVVFDAHHDNPPIEVAPGIKSPLCNANVVSHIRSSVIDGNDIYVIGARASSSTYSSSEGINIITSSDLDALTERLHGRPVYISLDIDVLDPAYAPHVNYPWHGGPSPEELKQWVAYLFRHLQIVGIDVVEVCGSSENHNSTAQYAVDIIEMMLLMLEHKQDDPC